MKNLIAIALFFLCTQEIFAQTPITQPPPSNGKFRGGIMVNPALVWSNANVDNTAINNVSTKGITGGFAYGLIGDYFFNNNYGLTINPRVMAFTTQFQYTPDVVKAPSYSINRTLNLQYIELPFCLKMRTNEVGYMKYFGQVGFMPAVKLSARGDIDTTLKTPVKNLNVNDNVNIFMIYSVIGVGVEYNLGGTSSIIGSFTWNNGFTNVWNKAKDNFNSPPANITLNVGFMF